MASQERQKARVATLISRSCAIQILESIINPWSFCGLCTDKLLLPGKQLSPSLKKLSRDFCRVIRKYALFDLWRIAHPMERTISLYVDDVLHTLMHVH